MQIMQNKAEKTWQIMEFLRTRDRWITERERERSKKGGNGPLLQFPRDRAFI